MVGFQSRPFGQGPGQRTQSFSPQSPQTPAGSTFQTNVNRQKTRKWVEARKQTYDGDDWGGDDYEIEPDVPYQPQPQPPTSRLPSQGIRYDAQAASNALSPASSLSSQRMQGPRQSYGEYQVDSDPAILQRNNTTRKPVGSSAQPLPVSSVSRTSNDVPPQPDLSHPRKASNSAHSTETPSQTQSAPRYEIPERAQQQDDGAQQMDEDDTRGSSEEVDRQGSSSSPTLPDVARMSAFGTDLFNESAKGTSAAVRPSSPIIESPSGAQAPAPEPSGPPNERLSVVSAQESETKVPASTELDNAQSQVVDDNTDVTPSTLWRPSVPGQGRTEPVRDVSAERDVSPVSERNATGAATRSGPATEPLTTTGLTGGVPAVAPLRTPSPRVSRTSFDPTASNPATEPPYDGTVETPQFRDGEYSPSEFDDAKALDRAPTFSTVTSSPVKESDILRDEIIKSLSPRQEAPPQIFSTNDPAHAAITNQSTVQAHAEAGARPSDAGATVSISAPPVAVAPRSESVSDETQQAEGEDRRRFSWEMSNEEPAATQISALGSTEDESPKSKSQETLQQSKSGPEPGNPMGIVDVTSVGSPEVVEPSNEELGVSHQVSKASSAQNAPDQARSAGLDPPSPVSEPGDRHHIQKAGEQGASPLNREGTTMQPKEGTQPAPGRTPVAVPSQSAGSSGPLMTFREIMSLGNCAERIAKFDEARLRFATIDSGLGDWIADLTAIEPDHANAGPSFARGAVSQGEATGNSRLPTPTAGQVPSQQQPYYQQYLNATSPPVAGQSSARSRFANLPHTAQAAGSAFGHSSNQIGTKGKEFMQSAGKMGKGLFTKGKSKLRGDKPDESPPATPVQGKAKSERRSSWAMNLTNRSRTGLGLTSQSSLSQATSQSVAQSSQPSTVGGRTSIGGGRPLTGGGRPSFEPQAGRMSLDRTRGSHVHDPQGHNGRPAPAPGFQEKSHVSGHAREPSLPLNLKSQNNSAWDPFNGTPYASQEETGGVTSDTHYGNVSQLTEAADVRTHDNVGGLADGSSAGRQSLSDARPQGLKRDPSFGLPHIKRSDTLDLGLATFQSTDKKSSETPPDHPLGQDRPASRREGSASSQARNDPTGQRLDAPLPPAPQREDTQSSPRQQTSFVGDTATPSGLPKLKTPPADHKGVPLPAGPWKLEESHLSAPLHQVSRKRSDTGESQQITYGFDKETGLTSPVSPTSPPPMTNFRQRAHNNLPPSSAQRYPELFRNAQLPSEQHDRSDSSASDAQGSGGRPSFPRTQSNDYAEDDNALQGERDRRKASGLFKDFGSRFAKSASRERRGSAAADAAQASEVVRSDGASEASVWSESTQDRKKKRSSLLGLRRRPSADSGISRQATHDEYGGAAPQSDSVSASSQPGYPRNYTEGQPSQPRNNRLFALQGKVTGMAGLSRRTKQDGISTAPDADRDSLHRSTETPPPPGSSREDREQRGRRGSIPNMISGMLGRSSSRNRAEEHQAGFGKTQDMPGYHQPASGAQRSMSENGVSGPLVAGGNFPRSETAETPSLPSAMAAGSKGPLHDLREGQRGASRMSLPAPVSGAQGFAGPASQGNMNREHGTAMELPRCETSSPAAEQSYDARRSTVSLSQSSSLSKTQGAPPGSRWKGIKGRMTGQLAQIKGKSQDEKQEKSGGGKLMAAFKRSSKLQEQMNPSRQSPAPHDTGISTSQGSQQHLTDNANPLSTGLYNSQYQGLNAHTQPPIQTPGPASSFSFQSQHPALATSGPGAHDATQPLQPAVPSSNASHFAGQSHSSYSRGPTSPPEKQYEQVPIPQAYGAVGSSQATVPVLRPVNGNTPFLDAQNYRNFETGRPQPSSPPAPQGHFQSQQQASASPNLQPHFDTQVHPQQTPPQHQVPQLPQPPVSFQPQSQVPPQPQSQAQPQPPMHQQAPQRRTVQGQHPPQLSQMAIDRQEASRSPAMRSHDRFASHPPPDSPPTSSLPAPPTAVRPDYPRGDSEVLPRLSQTSVQRKPTVASEGGREDRASPNLGVDVVKANSNRDDDIYDVTPRITQDDTRSQVPENPIVSQPVSTTRQTPQDSRSPQKAKEGKTPSNAFVMELEDTEEARKRTMRLDSQEEKIFYDPADDEENPAMCATSYPGQEWNPYGDLDLMDLGDDDFTRK